jgi:hypothetical protein
MDTSSLAALIDALEATATVKARNEGKKPRRQPASNQPPPQIQEAGSTSLFSAPEPASEPGTSEPTPGRRCSATTKAGKPCRTYARTGRDFCYAHDQESRQEFISSSASAGLASGEARRRAFDIEGIWFTDNLGVQTALDALFRLELSGQLPNNRVRNLVRILAIAARGVSRSEPLDRQDMIYAKSILDYSLVDAVEGQRRADISRARQDVENQVMERGQLAVDIERWPSIDNRPVSSRRFDEQLHGHYRSAREHPDFR